MSIYTYIYIYIYTYIIYPEIRVCFIPDCRPIYMLNKSESSVQRVMHIFDFNATNNPGCKSCQIHLQT